MRDWIKNRAEKEKFTFEKVEMKALGRHSLGAVLEVADSGSADGICAERAMLLDTTRKDEEKTMCV